MTLLLKSGAGSEGVLVLTLNRPERRNALSKPLLEDLQAAIAEAELDSQVRCLVITGTGDRAFCAGADISEQTGFNQDDAYAHMRWGQEIFSRIANLNKPSIAAVNGFALGGGLELALACDFRIASETAELGSPEVNLGNLPGWGGTQRLRCLVGDSHAKLIAMTGRRFSAADSLQMGLVNSVAAPEKLMEEAIKLAIEIASHAPEALQEIKEVIRFGELNGSEQGYEAEARAVARLWGSPSQKKAQEAFFSKAKR